MKISVFYDHITEAVQQTGKSPAELFAACRSFGIEGLEINYSQLREGGAKLYRKMKEAGIDISCIYEFYDFVTVPI